MRCTLAALGVLAASGCATGPKLRETPRTAVRCWPSFSHPQRAADLDGDGGLDRVTVTSEPDRTVVTLVGLPGLQAKRQWVLPVGRAEVAMPLRRATTRGDLWVRIGGGKPWSEALFRLDGDEAVEVLRGARRFRVDLDVDGDGRVDPIAVTDTGVRWLFSDAWVPMRVETEWQLLGVPLENGQAEARDLDGDGTAELGLELNGQVALADVPSFGTRWSVSASHPPASFQLWGQAPVLVVRDAKALRLYATDASHALLATFPDTYALAPSVRLTSGDSLLAIGGWPARLFDRQAPEKPVASVDSLASSFEDTHAEVRLAAGDVPGVVTVSHEPFARYRVALVNPRTGATLRSVWTSEPITSALSTMDVKVIDLDGDGVSELLVAERHSVEEHHGASWAIERLRLINGAGQVLWTEQSERRNEWLLEDEQGATRPRQTVRDETAVRALDLGDGSRALQIRTAGAQGSQEYFVVPEASTRLLPSCLE